MPMASSPRACASGSVEVAEWTSSQTKRESSQIWNTSVDHPHPWQVTWEMTPGWKAAPARALGRSFVDRNQFSTAEGFHLVEEVAAMHVPLLTLTGGDPLTRPDLFPIIEFASRRSVRTSLTLPSTPLLTPQIIADLKESGLIQIGFWLHGSTAALDDAYKPVQGRYRRTLDIIRSCHEVELPVQINTIVARRNFHDLDRMIELLTHLDVALWNVFFQVPARKEKEKEQDGEMLTGDEFEQIFGKLYAASRVVHFQIKTTEGQHYQRYLLQQRARELRRRISENDTIANQPKGVNDSRGLVFVNHRGEAYPSRFLPFSGGNVMAKPLSEIYCSSLFTSLRDSSRLKGKCGRCPVRNVCGGSRARAYAVTGDLFAPEPCCAYEP